MNKSTCLSTGRLLFAIATLAIGLIHIVNQNFPVGLLPVPPALPGRIILVNLTGGGLIISGVMLLINKLRLYGAIMAGLIWLVMIVCLHLPRLLFHLHNPDAWTGTFECIGLLCGVCMLLAYYHPAYKPAVIGRYLYLAVLIVFAALHIIYVQFIAHLVPAWLPGHLFWSYVVMLAFIAAALSIAINKQVKLAALLLGLMFLIWVLILHLPRALVNPHSEPEWTSLFVAMAMAGVSLLLADTAQNNS